MLRLYSAAFILGTVVMFAAPQAARAANDIGPGWLGVVVARGELKEQIESTPIVDRPNRPFHFYGNTVRREYYRGTALPRPGDFAKGGAALVFKRKQGS
jgi:hypothetical protein